MSWSSSDVRALLRNLRKPDALERLPLAVLLKAHFDLRTGFEATMHLIADSFAGRGQGGERLHEVLIRYDLDGQVNREQAASQMGLSSRQFFRYRAHAVEMIAQHLRSILDADVKLENTWTLASILAQHDPRAALGFCSALEPLEASSEELRLSIEVGREPSEAFFAKPGGIDEDVTTILKAHSHSLAGRHNDANQLIESLRAQRDRTDITPQSRVCIERELLIMNLQRTLESGDAGAATEFAQKLRDPRFAGEDPFHTHALLYDGQIAVCVGDLERADRMVSIAEEVLSASRNLRGLAWCLLLRAEIGFSREKYGCAQQSAAAARIALEHHPLLAAQADALLGRIALALDERWERPPRSYDAYCYRDTELDLIAARHLLASNAIDAAEQLTKSALRTTREQRYTGLESYALATLGSLASQRGDSVMAQERYVGAWCISARLDNALLKRDLFRVPRRMPADLGPIQLDERFASALIEVVAAAFPQAPAFLSDEVSRSLVPEVIALIRQAASADNVRMLRSPEILRIVERLIAANVSRECILIACAQFPTITAAALAPVLPSGVQARFSRKLCELLDEMLATIACTLGTQAQKSMAQ
ncbi:MAG: hypothetical protein M3Y21_00615 [Candidatus Eremiobacteraeota bacterium]|nr:hypothetical protein [Candidatus Eremiobacteraeota bacterium]